MVVVDSCILILLLKINKLFLLKNIFDDKIFITKEVYEELLAGEIGTSEFKDACKNWIKISKKYFHGINEFSKNEKIAKADASIILLAEQRKDILISNNYALITIAKTKNVKCWWLTTFILQCLKRKLLTKKQTKNILFELIESGMRLRNDVFAIILEEIEKF